MQKVITILEKLVSYDTSKSSSLYHKEILNYITELLKPYSLDIITIDSEISGNKTLIAKPKYVVRNVDILLSGHLDIVSVNNQNWSTNPFKLTQKNNKFFGRGTSDMKGFIACVLASVGSFLEKQLNFMFVFTYDEETLCYSIKEAIEYLLKEKYSIKSAIVGEPTEMKICTSHKGVFDMEVSVYGKACHSSNPANGINSIEISIKIIKYLKKLETVMKKMFFNNIYKPSYSTFNIGIINGGESINVVPSFCNLKFDFRPVNQEAENFMFRKLNIYLLKLEKKENCSIEIKKLCEIPPLFNKKISKNKCFPATTEGGYYDKIGISTIICGPGSIKLAHKENEFVTTKQLEMCLEFLEKL